MSAGVKAKAPGPRGRALWFALCMQFDYETELLAARAVELYSSGVPLVAVDGTVTSVGGARLIV